MLFFFFFSFWKGQLERSCEKESVSYNTEPLEGKQSNWDEIWKESGKKKKKELTPVLLQNILKDTEIHFFWGKKGVSFKFGLLIFFFFF